MLFTSRFLARQAALDYVCGMHTTRSACEADTAHTCSWGNKVLKCYSDPGAFKPEVSCVSKDVPFVRRISAHSLQLVPHQKRCDATEPLICLIQLRVMPCMTFGVCLLFPCSGLWVAPTALAPARRLGKRVDGLKTKLRAPQTASAPGCQLLKLRAR